MSERVVREKNGVKLVRSGLGQVVSYDVYRGGKYVGGGSKREGNRVFNRETKG